LVRWKKAWNCVMPCPACLGGNSNRASIVVGIRAGQAFGEVIENRQQGRSAVN
jgi:hypothetical protein